MNVRALQVSTVGVVAMSLVIALGLSACGTAQEPTSTKERKVVKTDAEWRKILTKEQYMVTRQAATEPAYTGKLTKNHAKGTYECVCCETELFTSKTKFESGTGWPSFYAPAVKKNVELHQDADGSGRVEVNCNTCGAHLGHVFDDGPAPTGLRFCMNSAALKFVKEVPPAKTAAKDKAGKAADKTDKTEKTTDKTEKVEKVEKVEKKDTPAKEAPAQEAPAKEAPK